MGLILTTFLVISLVTFIVLLIGTIVNELLSLKSNFFYTHWLLGRLTGLWQYDFLVDISIVAFCIGAVAALWVHRKLR